MLGESKAPMAFTKVECEVETKGHGDKGCPSTDHGGFPCNNYRKSLGVLIRRTRLRRQRAEKLRGGIISLFYVLEAQ